VSRAPALALLALLALAGCRTLPAAERELARDDPRVALRLAALHALEAERTGLRASARSSSSGPGGGAFSSQLVLAQRPARPSSTRASRRPSLPRSSRTSSMPSSPE